MTGDSYCSAYTTSPFTSPRPNWTKFRTVNYIQFSSLQLWTGL